MTTPEQDLLCAFDGHDVDGVRAALLAGAEVHSRVEGKLPIYWLLEQYERSDQLGDCLRMLFERGATLDDLLRCDSDILCTDGACSAGPPKRA